MIERIIRRGRPAGASTAGETKERLLQAAVNVFASRGYHATSVDNIVSESQTSKGTFYFHFPSKEAIFLTLLDHLADRLIQRVERAIDSERGALNRIDGALQTVLEEVSSQRTLARILLVEAAGIGHSLDRRLFAIHARFAGLIKRRLDEAVADGSIEPIDTETVAFAWLGAINEVLIHWLYSNERGFPSATLLTLRNLLMKSIARDQ